jgi:tRNA A37 methylthiotransferase MiaB
MGRTVARGRAMTDPKKLFIKTYGCQMNVHDSERMAEVMGAQGYVTTDRSPKRPTWCC